jgi:hypothetical protein
LSEMYSGTTNLGVYVSTPVLVIVRKCTNPNPDLRYQNVAALRVSFDGLLNIQVRQDAGEELRRFITARMPVTSAEAIAALVVGLAGDAKLLHDAVVAMPADTFARISQAKSEVAALLIDKFEEIALSVPTSHDNVECQPRRREAGRAQRRYGRKV